MADVGVTNKRKSNIELVKILCMIGIIILHICNSLYGGGLDYASKPWNYLVLNMFVQLAYCAVDLLLIISGYFLSKRDSVSLVKPITLLLQVIIFKLLFYLLSCIVAKEEPTFNGIMFHLIPTSYYAVLYIALYLISPLINKVFAGLDKKTINSIMLLLFILFSVEPWAADVLKMITADSLQGLSFISNDGSGGGYTLVNFVLCYIIGLWIKNCFDFKKIRFGIVVLLWCIVYTLNLICRLYIEFLPLEYCSPFVISQAALTFCIFLKKDFSNKAVDGLAKASFTVYLLNTRVIIFLAEIIHKMVEGNLLLMICGLILFSLLLYGLSYIIYLIYDLIINRLLIGSIVKRFKLDIKTKIVLRHKDCEEV